MATDETVYTVYQIEEMSRNLRSKWDSSAGEPSEELVAETKAFLEVVARASNLRGDVEDSRSLGVIGRYWESVLKSATEELVLPPILREGNMRKEYEMLEALQRGREERGVGLLKELLVVINPDWQESAKLEEFARKLYQITLTLLKHRHPGEFV